MRNATGILLPNANVGVKISLLQGSTNGTVVFSETHNPTTNANGLISIFVGSGTPISGNLATINWGNGTYFLKSELDIAGGTNYTLSQTDQILSVAYALHATTAASVDWADVQNKPAITNNTFSGSYTDLTNKPTIPASFSGSYLDLTNKPIIVNNTFSGSYTDLTNKPFIPASFSGSYLDLTDKPIIVNNTFTGSYSDLTNKPVITNNTFSGSYTDLTNKPVILNNTFTGSYTDLTNKPIIPASFSGSYLDLSSKPTFAVVATTGSYNDLTNKPVITNNTFSGSYTDLTNKPTIPASFSGSYLDLTNKLIFAIVATTGSYNDLTNKPTITTFSGGNGVSISGTNQIVNTAPDRIVSISGINITVSGTYPAFTVTGASANAITFTGGAGISISGSNQIINTAAMPNGTIAGQMLYWDGTKWVTVQPANTHAEFLRYCNGVPTWGPCVPQVATISVSGNFNVENIVISDGGSTITSRGVCYGTNPNPTLNDSFTTNGSGVGSYQSFIKNLANSTNYYVRSYAVNNVGISYGNEITILSGFSIGNIFQGGVIAYLLQAGDIGYNVNVPHGLIAAPTDQSTGIQWYNGSCVETNATFTGIANGDGLTNTNNIVSIQGSGSYAAKLCYDLVLNTYSDWYLPNQSELEKLYLNKNFIDLLDNTYYWTSLEVNSCRAWYLSAFNYFDFNDFYGKSNGFRVRAVRSF